MDSLSATQSRASPSAVPERRGLHNTVWGRLGTVRFSTTILKNKSSGLQKERKNEARIFMHQTKQRTSVGDLDPQNPHVFGPPGSGLISQRY